MPRPKQILSIEQIEDFLTITETSESETIQAVRKFLQNDLTRRINAGNAKIPFVKDKQEANREYQRRWQQKQIQSDSKD